VVNDGSTDGTADVVHKFANNTPGVRSIEERLIVDRPIQAAPDERRPVELRLLENPGNRGKGYSVRAGMLAARGEVVLFTDADLSAPIEEAERLFDAIRRARTSPLAPAGCRATARPSASRFTASSSAAASTPSPAPS